VWLALWAALLLAAPGCSDSQSGSDDSSRAATVDAAQWTFASPQAFLAHLQTLSTPRQRAELLAHMYARSPEEQWAVRYHGEAARAEVEFLDALAEAFGPSPLSHSAQMTAFALAPPDASIEPLGETRALVRFTNQAGEEDLIVLARIRGAWSAHATTLNDGSDITALWCNAMQNEYSARIKYVRDVALDVRRGRYGTLQQAQQALKQAMDGPPPPRGSVQLQ
jgi:hypothetical protein